MHAFAQLGYAVLPRLISPSSAAFLADYALKALTAGMFQPGDDQVPGSPCCYGEPLMEAVLAALAPALEAESGKRLHATYSYLRVYKQGDVLERHTDRPACEISVTLALSRTAWPIWLESQGTARSIALDAGDALLYRGIELPHWRDALSGERTVQLFLHYVDADGPHRELAFDRRPSLGALPETTRLVEQFLL